MHTKPKHHYVAYIDESGDDGLTRVKPLDKNGSSEWLVLSAVIVSADREKEVVGWVRDILRDIRSHQRPDLHFTNLNGSKKERVCKKISNLPLRCFTVASNKKNMKGYKNPFAEQIPSKNWFYCWMTRLLLERVTHFVRHRSIKDHGEIKKVKIEYSKRGGLSYSQMKAYYEWLKVKGKNLYLPMGHVDWSVMDRELLEIHSHKDRAGLQLADCVASAFFKAVDIYDTGACDPSFAKLLEPRMGRDRDTQNGLVSGYGLKLMPSMNMANLEPAQKEIFHHYGYPKQWWAPVPDDPLAF